MKKVICFSILLALLTSCYEDYIKDYDFNAVYFTYQTDVRTLVVGEGMKINIGVALGGVRENTIDRNVTFTIKNDLITPEILTKMKNGLSYIKQSVEDVDNLLPIPGNYYTLSSNSIVIKKGEHTGSVVLEGDSINFLSDPSTINATYAIPLYITDADADTILQGKSYSIIGLKYENMLFGNYWHGGVTTVKDVNGTIVETINYFTRIPAPEGTVWRLTTVAPNKLVTNGYSNNITSKPEILLTLNGSKIIVSSADGSSVNIEPDGESIFNNPKLLQDRKLFLNYKYSIDDKIYYVKDTLTFRNRIRDGVNEWQDENPSHY